MMPPAASQGTPPGPGEQPAPVRIISFGYGHQAAPPAAHVTFDVRTHFKDPHIDPELRNLTARDPRVTEAVLATPGVAAVIGSVTAAAAAYLAGPRQAPVTIAVGCVGGRHRSAVIAATAAARLASQAGIRVHLVHRDLDKPVIRRPSGEEPLR